MVLYERKSKDFMSYDLHGAIDLHIHAGPSVAPRSVDGIELFRETQKAGYEAFIIKEHYIPSVFEAQLINKHLRQEGDPMAYGGVVLNNSIGGLNLMAVDAACCAGGKFVCLPTVSAQNHQAHQPGKFPGSGNMTVPEKSLYYLDESGELLPEVVEVLTYVKEHPDVFLMTGHATVAELDAVVRKSAELGLKKVLVNHPQYHIGATIEDMVKWAELGAYIEINACVFQGIGTTAKQPMSLAKEMIDSVPPEQMILDSDLGQKKNCTPVVGMARFVGFLMDELGLPEKQIDTMLKDNPKKLLY